MHAGDPKMECRRRAVRSAPRSPFSSPLSRRSPFQKLVRGGSETGSKSEENACPEAAVADGEESVDEGEKSAEEGERRARVFSSPLSCQGTQSGLSCIYNPPSREDGEGEVAFRTPTPGDRCRAPQRRTVVSLQADEVKTPSKDSQRRASHAASSFSPSLSQGRFFGDAAASPALGVGRPAGSSNFLEETPVLRRERERASEGRASLSAFLAQVEDLLLRTSAPSSSAPWWDVDVAQMLSFFLSLSESGAIQLGDACPRAHAKDASCAAASAFPRASQDALSGDEAFASQRRGGRAAGRGEEFQGLGEEIRDGGFAASSPIVTPRRFVAAAVAAVGGVYPSPFSPLTQDRGEGSEVGVRACAGGVRQGEPRLEEPSTYRMEFSQAALLLERLTKVWGQKIEHLHALFLHMLQSMHAVGDAGKGARGAGHAQKPGVSSSQNLRLAKHSVLQEVLGRSFLFLPTFPRESEMSEDLDAEENAENRKSRPPDIVRLPAVLRRKRWRPEGAGERNPREDPSHPADEGKRRRLDTEDGTAGNTHPGRRPGNEVEEVKAMANRYQEFKNFRLTSFLLHEASGGLMVDSRDAPLYHSLLRRPEKKQRIPSASSLPSVPEQTEPVPLPVSTALQASPPPLSSASSSSSNSTSSSSFSFNSTSSSSSSSSSTSSSFSSSSFSASSFSSLSCVSALREDAGRLPSEGLGEFLDFDDDGLCFDFFEGDASADPAPSSSLATDSLEGAPGVAGVHTPHSPATQDSLGPLGEGGVARSPESSDAVAVLDSSASCDGVSGDFALSLFWEEDRDKQKHRQELGIDMGISGSGLPASPLHSREKPQMSPVDRILSAWRKQEKEGSDRETALRRLLHATGPGDWNVCTAPFADAKKWRASRGEKHSLSRIGGCGDLGVCASQFPSEKENGTSERDEEACTFCEQAKGGGRREAKDACASKVEAEGKGRLPRRHQLMSLREEADRTERRPIRFGSTVRPPPPFYSSLPSSAFAAAPAPAALAFHRLHTPHGMLALLQGLWSAGELAAAEAVVRGHAEKDAGKTGKPSGCGVWAEALQKTHAHVRRVNGPGRLPFYPDIQLPCSPFAARLPRQRRTEGSSLVERGVSAERKKAKENENARSEGGETAAGGDGAEIRSDMTGSHAGENERNRRGSAECVPVSACSAIGGIIETSRWKWIEDVVYARLRRRALLRRRLRRKGQRLGIQVREGEKTRLSLAAPQSFALVSIAPAAEAAEILAEVVEEKLLQPLEPTTWRELEDGDADVDGIVDASDNAGASERDERENRAESFLEKNAEDDLQGVSLLSAAEKERLQLQLRAAAIVPLIPAADAAEEHMEGFSLEAVQMKRSDQESLQRVARWTVFLEEELRRSSSLPPFDIRAYEQKVLQRVDGLAKNVTHLPALCGSESASGAPGDSPGPSRFASPDGRENKAALCALEENRGSGPDASDAATCPAFSDVARGREKYEVCRLFLATLMLINKGKLDIRQAGVTEGNTDEGDDDSSWELFVQGKLGNSSHDGCAIASARMRCSRTGPSLGAHRYMAT
ncbi:conserved hypothetical protein [Neospora caninum Liverpool]|uniref:Condensin-2 complex subunit H2 C-terminal domain-containing protein n=1 Tax=Neospora caninum (strain Liverpool) TaxID=572307 RepID=F0VCZ7_NEOCL|nr:conserved hypothetical protein [Neospora caninum Liverpool]CBZ51512.1 conserved hypothetical protein [Neospora caninum Liverpool]|eukprot:XP_003881545.1 conserved hypothetical protein [Neospora caninum Liverpool]